MNGPIASPGSMNVDWEERWNVERLRQYRFGRARAALEASDLGAILAFDFNNIRYLTSTHATSRPAHALITAAMNEAPKVNRYDATTRGEATASQNAGHVIPAVFRNIALSGSSTMRPR